VKNFPFEALIPIGNKSPEMPVEAGAAIKLSGKET
jgi:hypothetical protein